MNESNENPVEADGGGEDFTTDGKFAPGNTIGHRFTPGVSGNPKGRKPYALPRIVINEELEQHLEEPCTHPKFPGLTNREAFVHSLVNRAIRGQPSAQREVINRVWGRVPMALEVSGDVTLTARPEPISTPEMFVSGIDLTLASEEIEPGSTFLTEAEQATLRSIGAAVQKRIARAAAASVEIVINPRKVGFE
jgi:hypothetical protein